MSKKYFIKTPFRLLRDEASVKFHVASDDYFGTIATVISLLKQECQKSDKSPTDKLLKLFDNLEKDFLLLQKNYQINARTKNKNKTPKGKLKSQ